MGSESISDGTQLSSLVLVDSDPICYNPRPMDLSSFEALVRSLAAEIPADFLAGVAEITVSPRTVPHPDHPEIFTLGQCVPLPATSDHPDAVVSRVVLYYGSFAALARDDPDFDWDGEAWETLTHEV